MTGDMYPGARRPRDGCSSPRRRSRTRTSTAPSSSCSSTTTTAPSAWCSTVPVPRALDEPLERWVDLQSGPSPVFVGRAGRAGRADRARRDDRRAARRGRRRAPRPAHRRRSRRPTSPPTRTRWRPTISALRVFRGYAGWGPGQLDGEIEAGAWLVLDSEPSDLFTDEPDELWRTVLRRQPGRLGLARRRARRPQLELSAAIASPTRAIGTRR